MRLEMVAIQRAGTPAGPPASGEVEIAYFTFPPFEGRGIASAMARKLIAVARAAQPGIGITARTLPRKGPSIRVLEKPGFTLRGTVRTREDGEVWEWELGAQP